MRFVILHYHIFKNAGSTVEDILDHSFGERFGTLETPADAGLVSNQELLQFLDSHPALRAFSSHQIRYPMPLAQGYLFFDICFLRDPIDRLRSFYDYFRQKPNAGNPVSALSNRRGLGDFVADMLEHHSLFVRNNQVNLLACAGDSDEPEERDLELAIRRMRAASFLGVVDCFEQSVVAGAEALRVAFPELDFARPAVNVSRGLSGTVASRIAEVQEACRPDVFAELMRVTELDRRLVELARADVLRRFEEVSARAGRAERPKAGSRMQGRSPSPPPPRNIFHLVAYWRELAGHGRAVLRDHPLFDAEFYLRKYPDVVAAGVDPLLHYLKYGTAEMRQPHPLFDPVFYLGKNPDVRRAGVNPLLHYVKNGEAEGRKPHPLFEPSYYRNTLVHFLNCGAAAASPHPLFDCRAYREAHPEVDINPLLHYVLSRTDQSGTGIEILDVQLDETQPQQMPFLRALNPEQIQAQRPSSR